MSLINEALKKAQRLRAEEAADPSGTSHLVGSHTAKRGKSHSANFMVLIGSGALVLVVLSVVFTVFLVNRTAHPATPVAVAPAPKPGPTSVPAVGETSTPAIVAPKITSSPATPVTPAVATTPSATETVVVAPAPVSQTTPPISLASVGATTVSPPVVATPSSSVQPTPAAAASPALVAAAPAPQPALAPDAPDERVSAFVEAIRVTGIRSSGAESRVLMNERVYRVNDIVERTLGVRLIKAAADRLTFSDARGVIYEKNF